MPTHSRLIAFGILILAATALDAQAEPVAQSSEAPSQIAATAPVPLPEVLVHPAPQGPSWFYDPYTSGQSQHVSSHNHIAAQHYRVPVGYDSNPWMHPYTSGIGPCAENASPSQGCHHVTGTPIPQSHYERAPFNQ